MTFETYTARLNDLLREEREIKKTPTNDPARVETVLGYIRAARRELAVSFHSSKH